MTPLSISLIAIYVLCFVARLWSLRAAWTSPLLHGESYFIDVPVAPGFYQLHGRSLLRRYRTLITAPYGAELCIFLLLFAAGKLNYLTLLLLAGIVAASVNTIAAGRIVRQQVRRFQVREEEPAPSCLASPLEARRLAAYTNPPLEAGLAFGNLASLVLLMLWSRDSGAGFWPTFRLPALLLYAQAGFLLVKHAMVAWRTAIPVDNAEEYLDFRERVRGWFIEICDWLRAHAVAFLLTYAALRILGPAQNDIRVRWAILTPWTAMAIVMTIRIIRTSNGLRAYGMRLKPLRVRPASTRATALLYCNPDDPAVIVRGPLGFTLNFSNSRARLYLAYAAGLLAIVGAASLA